MKKALVFGSSSDIGACIAHELIRHDYHVTGTYFTSKPTGHLTIKCDIRSIPEIDQVFSKIPDHSLNVIVLSCFPFLESDPFDWTAFVKAQSIHTGHMRIIHHAKNKLVSGGRVVNILGQCVRHGLPAAPNYSAYFAHLHNFANSVNGHAAYGKAFKLNLLDVLLAAVDTREWQGVSAAVKATYEKRMGKFIRPEEVAKRVVFELQCQIMATELVIDGSVLI